MNKLISLPKCLEFIDSKHKALDLILRYSHHLKLKHGNYSSLILMAQITLPKLNINGKDVLDEMEYSMFVNELHCTEYRKLFRNKTICHICNAGANCNNMKVEEGFLISYLLKTITKQIEKNEILIHFISNHNNFVSIYDYSEDFFYPLFEEFLKRINKDSPFYDDLGEKGIENIDFQCIFDDVPGEYLQEIARELKHLYDSALPEIFFDNNSLNKLLNDVSENAKRAKEKIQNIELEKNNLNQVISLLVEPERSKEKDDIKVQLEDKSIVSNVELEISLDIEEPLKGVEQLELFTDFDNTLKNDLSDINKNIDIDLIHEKKEDKIVKKLRDESTLNTPSNLEYFYTSKEIEQFISYPILHNFESIIEKDSISTIWPTFAHIEYIPESKELLSFNFQSDQPMAFKFDDVAEIHSFGMNVIENKRIRLLSFNSIPLINYFEGFNYFLSRKNFFDFQLGYTIVNFLNGKDKILRLEDFNIIEKNNNYKTYRNKVISSIKNYDLLYKEFIKYFDIPNFKKRYHEEVGLRYLVGRSSKLEISTGRGLEEIVRYPIGFNYKWLIEPDDIKNRNDILDNKVILIGEFKNLAEYVDTFITYESKKTPLGYNINFKNDYKIDYIKKVVCEEITRTVLVNIMRHWGNERSSFRLLYFDDKQIMIMVEKNRDGIDLGYDTLYDAMKSVPKTLLPGIIPHNSIIEIT